MMCHPLGNLKWRAGNNDKTETVEHKCNCALTEKGQGRCYHTKAKTKRFEFWRQNKVCLNVSLLKIG